MAKDLIIGLSAIFVIWGSAIVWASSRLVWRNAGMLPRWFQIDRESRVRMCLWLAVPGFCIMMVGQRLRAFIALAADRWVSDFGSLVGIGLLVLGLVCMALSLFWAFDRTYAGINGPTYSDRMWCIWMWGGVAVGAVASVVSWYF